MTFDAFNGCPTNSRIRIGKRKPFFSPCLSGTDRRNYSYVFLQQIPNCQCPPGLGRGSPVRHPHNRARQFLPDWHPNPPKRWLPEIAFVVSKVRWIVSNIPPNSGVSHFAVADTFGYQTSGATYVILLSVRSVCSLMIFSGTSSSVIFLVLMGVISMPDAMHSITRGKVPWPECPCAPMIWARRTWNTSPVTGILASARAVTTIFAVECAAFPNDPFNARINHFR